MRKISELLNVCKMRNKLWSGKRGDTIFMCIVAERLFANNVLSYSERSAIIDHCKALIADILAVDIDRVGGNETIRSALQSVNQVISVDHVELRQFWDNHIMQLEMQGK